MPAAGSQRSSSARATCGWRRLPGTVLTSTRTATSARLSRSVICSAVAVPCPNVSSISLAILCRPGWPVLCWPGLRGRDEMSGQAAGRAHVQRCVTDEKPVPQHAVGHIDQHAEVGGGGDLTARAAALEQGAQRGAALGGEFRQYLSDVLVLLGGRYQLTQRPLGARGLQLREAVGQEQLEVFRG